MLVPSANAVDVGTITPFGIENVPPVGVTCIEYELPFVHKLGIGAKVGVAGLIILIDIVRVIGQLIAEGVIKQVYVIIVFTISVTLFSNQVTSDPIQNVSNFTAGAGNLTQLNFGADQQTDIWQGYFGEVTEIGRAHV